MKAEVPANHSRSVTVRSYEAAVEEIFDRGWSDGLPVIPPTPTKVAAFLEAAELQPDVILGEIPERDRVIRAEKVAINAVMAGCRKEYMPVLVAAVQAITDARFKFNHLASLGSPAPMLVISGPIVDRLGMNYGTGVMGPGARANATIGRALSLLLWNCAEMRTGALVRGTYGNPLRWTSCCIAENPNALGWMSLRESLGFSASDSTVTVMSTSEGYVTPWLKKPDPVDTLLAISDSMATGNFARGVYLVLISPAILDRFVRAGWSRSDVQDWLRDNCRRSLADLKRRGRWGMSHNAGIDGFPASVRSTDFTDKDAETFLYLFKSNGDLDSFLWNPSQLEDRDSDTYLVITGGDFGATCVVIPEYPISTNPITRHIN